MGRYMLSQLNSSDQDQFAAAIGFVFEHSPWIARDAWHRRPFASVADLHAALCAVMLEASIDQQLALLRTHPDLAGKAALAGTLTPESASEQQSAGLDRLTPDQLAALTTLNQQYRDRFGFPFILCAREHSKESILAAIAERVANAPEHEHTTALHEVAKIADLRLRQVLQEEN